VFVKISDLLLTLTGNDLSMIHFLNSNKIAT